MDDFLFRGSLEELDPAIYELTRLESERQFRKIILIPSESQAPMAVREALSSAFQNIYAEGYPREETRTMSEEEIMDFPARLVNFRRYADKRYYKGVEYADTIEELARRRCAELFANELVDADDIFRHCRVRQRTMPFIMPWSNQAPRLWAWIFCMEVI
jgi:glycine hydroxymethyltransferase